MGSGDDESLGLEESAAGGVRELRRGYHDRIASLREASFDILRLGVDGVGDATRALLESDPSVADVMAGRGDRASRLAASVDHEVVDLLALESPMARDLRVILTARDVSQISLLCVGLAQSLSDRVSFAGRYLGPELRVLVAAVGTQCGRVLDAACGAWVALDGGAVQEVFDLAEVGRRQLREFLAAIVQLRGVPVEAAIDLGLAARVYQRLGDHGIEIAERVIFAAEGVSPGISRSAR